MEPNAMKALQNLTPLNTGSVEVVGSIPSGSTKLSPVTNVFKPILHPEV